eukprot:5959018-Pyramimonas_sp.AAC.2
MESAIAVALDRLAPIINDKILEFEVDCGEDETAAKAKKSVANTIIRWLLDANLAYEEQIVPEAVGCHETNRFGFGLDAIDLHDLLEIVLDIGWDWNEVKGAWCVEVKPGAAGEQQYEFQKSLHSSSGGLIPSIKPHEMKVLSLTKGHTNAGLRASKQGAKTTIEKIQGSDGCISVDKVLALCPAYKEPMESGLTWVVVRHQAGKPSTKLHGN